MGELFKKPKVSDPTPMPVVDDASSRAAAERARKLSMNRNGRASLMLSRRSPAIRATAEGGTTAYTNTALGSAG